MSSGQLHVLSVLSEPGITSDRISRGPFCFVRTQYHFRQNLPGVLYFCPNSVSLRTKSPGRASFLSEPGITSDKISRTCFIFVRTRYHFRQNLPGVLHFCPNPVSLQTKSPGRASFLSEPGITSDRIFLSCSCFVRTGYHFGHNFPVPLLFCSNLAFLWTKSPGRASFLSESGITSDIIFRFFFCFVRIRYYFGQNLPELLLFCPNLASLRTKSPGPAPVLSDKDENWLGAGADLRDLH